MRREEGGGRRGDCRGCQKPAEVEISPGVETLLVQSEIGGFVAGERVKREADRREERGESPAIISRYVDP